MKNHHVTTLRRHNLKNYIKGIIHPGRGYQSTVYLAEVDGLEVAIKDFVKTPVFFRRTVAPFLLQREIRALKHLSGVPGVPKFYGRIDRYAFAMEFIAGKPVADFKQGELAPEIFSRIQQVIDDVHARGVSHGDLKRRSNILVTPVGDVFLIDFVAATIGNRPLHPVQNWLQQQMAEIDNRALPRLKKFVAPELLTTVDSQKLANPTSLEKLARKLLNR